MILSNNYHQHDTEILKPDTPIKILKPGDKYYITKPEYYRQIIRFEEDYILVRRYDGWYNRIYDLDKMVNKL